MGDLAVAWERSTGQQVGMLFGYATFLSDLEVSPNGDRLAYATYSWPAYIHDLEGQAAPRVLSIPFYEAFNIAFSPAENIVATGLYSYNPEPVPGELAEMVRVWEAGTGEEVQTLPDASVAAFSPDGRQIALADTRGNLRVVNLQNGEEACLWGCTCSPAGGENSKGCSLKLPRDLSPMDMSYSPDGKLLALWGVAGTWSASGLVDLSTGEEVAWFEGGSRISFGPDGLIALGVDELNADHGIAAHWLMLYDLVQGKELRRVELPAAGVAVFSPDGKWLAVGLSTLEITNPTGQDPPDPAGNGLVIWDVESWRQAAFFALPYGITRLTFSPDGEFLITASESGEILRWNRSP
jgi:WD40 repeat protein